MGEIMIEYIIQAEELLLMYPEDKLIESYLLQLESLKNVPDTYLKELNAIIPMVYEELKEVEDIAKKEVIFKLFSNMVEATKISVITDNPNATFIDFDDIYNENSL